MPTVGRLIAAILFGALTWYVSEGARAYADPPEVAKWSTELNVALGAIIAWIFMGGRVGQGFVPACGFGLTTAILIWFWTLFTCCFVTMVNKALRKSYNSDGPTEAVIDVFSMMVEFGQELFFHPEMIASILIGGLVAGILTEEIGRRFS